MTCGIPMPAGLVVMRLIPGPANRRVSSINVAAIPAVSTRRC
jgi:hypothetical protein